MQMDQNIHFYFGELSLWLTIIWEIYSESDSNV